MTRSFAHVEDYAAASEALGSGSAWLREIRQAGAAHLREHGFPARDEAWKYTRAAQMLAERFDASFAEGCGRGAPRGPMG